MVVPDQSLQKAAKTYLQEICQGYKAGLPQYEVLQVQRLTRRYPPYFYCALDLPPSMMASDQQPPLRFEGLGSSKKAAETDAAFSALAYLIQTSQSQQWAVQFSDEELEFLRNAQMKVVTSKCYKQMVRVAQQVNGYTQNQQQTTGSSRMGIAPQSGRSQNNLGIAPTIQSGKSDDIKFAAALSSQPNEDINILQHLQQTVLDLDGNKHILENIIVQNNQLKQQLAHNRKEVARAYHILCQGLREVALAPPSAPPNFLPAPPLQPPSSHTPKHHFKPPTNQAGVISTEMLSQIIQDAILATSEAPPNMLDCIAQNLQTHGNQTHGNQGVAQQDTVLDLSQSSGLDMATPLRQQLMQMLGAVHAGGTTAPSGKNGSKENGVLNGVLGQVGASKKEVEKEIHGYVQRQIDGTDTGLLEEALAILKQERGDDGEGSSSHVLQNVSTAALVLGDVGEDARERSSPQFMWNGPDIEKLIMLAKQNRQGK